MPVTESETPPPSEGEKKERRSSRPSLIEEVPKGVYFSYGVSMGEYAARIKPFTWTRPTELPAPGFTIMTTQSAEPKENEETQPDDAAPLSPRLLAPLAFAMVLVVAVFASPYITALFRH